MTPTTFEQAVDACLAEMRAVMLERHHKYGPNNIRKLGLLGVLSKTMNDKYERLRRHYERDDTRVKCLDAGMPQEIVDRYLPSLSGDFADDTLEDAHIDSANFMGPISLMLRRGWWDLPMADEKAPTT